MSIIDYIFARLAPYSCLGCGTEGRMLCVQCIAKMPDAEDRCYQCCKPTTGSITCPVCHTPDKPNSIRVFTVYKGIAKDMLWRLKSGGAQAATHEMASLLQPLVQKGANTLVVHVPTATTRVRQRGYDQARLLARDLAKQTHLPYADVLARSGQAHQVGANRAERLVQLAGAFRVTGAWQVRGAHIVLIDDVLTTGASFEAATKALMAAGAARVDAIAFARA